MTDRDLARAHAHASNHREEVLASKVAGCFYCQSTFSPAEIQEWLTERDESQTALCPDCSIDSVIGDKSGFPLTEEFLGAMCKFWFSPIETINFDAQ